jgi:hypothetical protein
MPMAMPSSGVPPVGTRQGSWVWDGTQWSCCDDGSIPGCPPGWPPPGCPPWWSGQNSPPWYPGANAGVSFGPTAPANPVRGHFWWNGTILAMFDGAVWVNTSSGAIVPPTSPPGTTPVVSQTTETFAIPQTSTVAVTVSTWVPLPFTSSPIIDTQSAWNPATYKLTPTQPGMYMFNIRAFLAGAGAGVMLVKNDSGSPPATTDLAVAVNDYASAGAGWLSATGVEKMNGSTDYVRFFVWSATTPIGLASSFPLFQAFRLP